MGYVVSENLLAGVTAFMSRCQISRIPCSSYQISYEWNVIVLRFITEVRTDANTAFLVYKLGSFNLSRPNVSKNIIMECNICRLGDTDSNSAEPVHDVVFKVNMLWRIAIERNGDYCTRIDKYALLPGSFVIGGKELHPTMPSSFPIYKIKKDSAFAGKTVLYGNTIKDYA